MDFESAQAYLESFVNYEAQVKPILNEVNFDLERVRVFLRRFGIDYSAIKFVHVAGSKGKGSVCDLIGRYLWEARGACVGAGSVVGAGKVEGAGAEPAGGEGSTLEPSGVGIFTSPHILSVKERFWANGGLISDANFARIVGEVKSFIDGWEGGGAGTRTGDDGEDGSESGCDSGDYLPVLTYFELLLVVALKYFVDLGVEYAVLEVGLGGRLDATNIVEPKLCVLTTVEKEHTEILGNTLEEIMGEKLGIVKVGVPLVVGYQSEEGDEIVSRVLKEKKDVYFMHDGLFGAKEQNMKMAFNALRILLGNVDKEVFGQVCEGRGLLGRGELREIEGKMVLFDMAHTVNSAKALRELVKVALVSNRQVTGQLEEEGSPKRLKFLIGMLKGKKLREFLAVIKKLDNEIDKVVFTNAHNVRGIEASEIDNVWKELGGEKSSVNTNSLLAFGTLHKSLKKDQVLVVTGSHFLIGDILSSL